MTRSLVRYQCGAVVLLMASWVPIDTSAARQRMSIACPFEIVGTWRLSTSTELEPALLSFSPQGWVNVLGSLGENRPGDLDIIAQVPYRLAPRREPKHIEFQARRGNDVFAPGTSRWEITAYDEESFTARQVEPDVHEPSVWSRDQTHRYFLTFAARDGTNRDATTARDAAAFVMWTTLDGHKTELEALGTAVRGTGVRFGRIPDELSEAFATQSRRSDDVMMRMELSEMQYHSTRQVFEAWNTLLSRDVLASDDPHGQAMQLLEATVQSVNRCGARIRLPDASSTAALERSAKTSFQQRPLEFVRMIRKLNDRQHVTDKVFPFQWKPPPITSS